MMMMEDILEQKMSFILYIQCDDIQKVNALSTVYKFRQFGSINQSKPANSMESFDTHSLTIHLY